jgi:hypothetical protein
LKEELDHTKGEILLTIEKLKKFEKRMEKLDEILSSQIYPNKKMGLGYNDSLKKTKKENKMKMMKPTLQNKLNNNIED